MGGLFGAELNSLGGGELKVKKNSVKEGVWEGEEKGKDCEDIA